MTGHDSRRVSPFRDPRIKGCLAPPRGLSQLTASFFACRRQGIHPMLLSTCSRNYFLPSLFNCKRAASFRSGRSFDRVEFATFVAPSRGEDWLGRVRPAGIWWSWTESNRLPPACKAGALPNELQPLITWWAWKDLSFRPHAYQACALNRLSYRPLGVSSLACQ